jgi:uncharacterized membrane protein YfcA
VRASRLLRRPEQERSTPAPPSGGRWCERREAGHILKTLREIPTLVFAFGADIKTAGTASLLNSLPTVAVGVLRHRRLGSFAESADLTQTVAPMGLGSVIGAVAGGLFVGVVPAALKFLLGVVLIVSAVRIFRGS